MAEPIISVDHVSFSYDEGGPMAVRDVSLTIERGSFHAILGQNGSGKSTLAKLINGLYIPTEGRVTVCGMDTQDDDKTWEIRRRAGMVFQNPDDQLVCSAVEDELAFGLENLCVPPDEIRRRVDAMMAEFGLSGMAESDPAKLSGGQKKLVTIASTLILGPKVIVLDEPITGLDADSREMVLHAVERLKERGCTVVAVEHDLSLASYADRILYLRDGKLNDNP